MKCKFVKAWIGKCNKEADDSGYCLEHKNLVCESCGAQATHTCAETMGLVCGAPLCDECEHEIAPDGTNGGVVRHCKKLEQKYTPWYTRSD
jgi:hypothetical protein